MLKMLWRLAAPVLAVVLFGCAGQTAQFSAGTKRLLNDLENSPRVAGKLVLKPEMKKKYGIRDTEDGPVVHAFIRVTPELNPESLSKLSIKKQSDVGDIQTVVVPVSQIKRLAKVRGVKHIEISTPVQFR